MSEPSSPGLDPDIGAYYDRAPEESRLGAGPSRLEELRTRELILRFAAPPPATVLDIGGGAGPYAFWLAERGYSVRLIDVAPRLVAIARLRNAREARPLVSCTVADARALPERDDSADVVLLLGPLYHLVESRDRHRALTEAARVLRDGGMLIAAGISRWASALDGLSRELLIDQEFARIVEGDLLDGRHRNPTERLDYFTTAYFHRPEDLRRELVDAGLDAEGPFGVEGPGWILPDFVNRWNDERRREVLVSVARMLESEPAMAGASAHLLVVGRKPRGGNA